LVAVGIAVVALGAFAFGVPLSTLVFIGLVLLCPLMMLGMHGGHGGHAGHGDGGN
jgi:hypothetical protein